MTSSFFMYHAEFLVSELFIHVSDSHQDHTEVSLIISCTRMPHSKVLNSFLQLLTLQSQVDFLLTINLRNYLDLKELKKKKDQITSLSIWKPTTSSIWCINLRVWDVYCEAFNKNNKCGGENRFCPLNIQTLDEALYVIQNFTQSGPLTQQQVTERVQNALTTEFCSRTPFFLGQLSTLMKNMQHITFICTLNQKSLPIHVDKHWEKEKWKTKGHNFSSLSRRKNCLI